MVRAALPVDLRAALVVRVDELVREQRVHLVIRAQPLVPPDFADVVREDSSCAEAATLTRLEGPFCKWSGAAAAPADRACKVRVRATRPDGTALPALDVLSVVAAAVLLCVWLERRVGVTTAAAAGVEGGCLEAVE